MTPYDQYIQQLSTPFDPSFNYINSMNAVSINNISIPTIDDEFTSPLYELQKQP